MYAPTGRTARFAALGLIAALALSACGSGSGAPTHSAKAAAVAPPAKLVESGSLTYGVAATFPPFESQQSGSDTGFDIEMGAALAGYMGLKPAALDIDFNGLIPALNGGRIDIINSAMYINAARAAQVDFVPYMRIGETLLVPVGNKQKIHKVPDDLSGHTIAVTVGAIGETYMTQFNAELKSAGKQPMNILSLPTNQDALLAVKSGRADAFDTSTPGAAYTLSQDKGVFEVAVTFALGTKIGIAIPKGSTELKTAIDSALKKFVADGSYGKLLKKYNLPAESNIFK